MSASGEGNNEPAVARTVELLEDLDGSSTAHTPALPPDIIATDLQCQIKANQALVEAFRDELTTGSRSSFTIFFRWPQVT